jgi:sugar O-acyltransferase (sialic acid O-acetyltransferase NeuD family)
VRPLLLVGAGGFGREVVEVVRAINGARPAWELLGFLDDAPELQGHEVAGVPVVGTTAAIGRFSAAQIVVCSGSPPNYFSRKRLVKQLGLPAARYATLIHPAAVVPPAALVGPGTVLLATVVVTTNAHVGAHVAIMPGVILTHDDIVGDYVTMGAGVRLAGGVTIGAGAYIGAGTLIRENLQVGSWALIGMGAVVLECVPAAQVWAGIPARHIRGIDVPADLA